ncbi:hypothetical protein ACFL1A_01615 [Patescibacteria group bacterium]
MRFISKSITVFLFSLVVFFLLPAKPAFAYLPENWVDSEWAEAYDECRNTNAVQGECYVERTNKSMIVATDCLINFQEGVCTNDPETARIMWPKSAIGMTTQIMAATYDTPPASTYAFFKDFGQTLGFIPKQAHAQGIGFTGMVPLLGLWKLFRNIAYLLLAVVMIVIGFMVMLRKKIDPKTVVTVQNSLPKIVITLLLITFSYAIVGMLIDLMYVIMFLVLNLFESVGALPEPTWIQGITGNSDPESIYIEGGLRENLANIRISKWQLLGIDIPTGGWSRFTDFGAFTLGGITALAGGLSMAIPGMAIVGIPTITMGGLAAMGAPLFGLLFSIFKLIIWVRLTFLFVTAYIQIILAMLLGPIQLLFEAVPGSNSFASWIVNLIANISVFPVAGVMFMLANVFTEFATAEGLVGDAMWKAPYVGLINNNTAIASIVALGLIATIPTVCGSIKEKLKAAPLVNAGPGAIVGPMGQGAGQIFQLGYQGMFIKSALHKPPGSTPVQRQMGGGAEGIKGMFGDKKG